MTESDPAGPTSSDVPPPRLLGNAEPRWRQAEFAWPLALAVGFVGCWIGLATTVPGLAPIVAGLGFAPLVMPLLESARRGLAVLCAVGWALGVAGAVVGLVLEAGWGSVADALPGAAIWTASEVRAFAEPGGTPGGAGGALTVVACALVLLALLARPFTGLLGFPALAWAVSVVAAGVGWFAEQAVLQGAEELQATLAGSPPYVVVALLAAVLFAVGMAEPARPWPFAGLPPGRRQLLGSAGILAVFALGALALFRSAWGESLARWLR